MLYSSRLWPAVCGRSLAYTLTSQTLISSIFISVACWKANHMESLDSTETLEGNMSDTVISAVPTDGLALSGVRPSAGSVMTLAVSTIFYKYNTYTMTPFMTPLKFQWKSCILISIIFTLIALCKPAVYFLQMHWRYHCPALSMTWCKM